MNLYCDAALRATTLSTIPNLRWSIRSTSRLNCSNRPMRGWPHARASAAVRPDGARASLHQRLPVVRDGTEGEGEDHGVESLVSKLQGLCVADPQVGLAPELVRSLASDVEHRSAEVDAG